VVSEAIEHGGCHLGVAEHLRPIGESQIGGDQQRLSQNLDPCAELANSLTSQALRRLPEESDLGRREWSLGSPLLLHRQ
jgi:hypothetical protein